jgi:pyridoxine 5-phosphate synthase
MSLKNIRLGVNIDHVATVRNARGGAHPDPVAAAHVAVKAGADSITAHLREDRRHILDEDMNKLRHELSVPLNFEMAATAQMLKIATALKPHAVCLVPENRMERTTEGGLDVIAGGADLCHFVQQLTDEGCRVSLFIDPDFAQIRAAVAAKAPVIELHTGTWCHAVAARERAKAEAEFEKMRLAASFAAEQGLEVHAGHGLTYETAEKLAQVAAFAEFNIGHFLIGEAIFVGLPAAIHTMRQHMHKGRGIHKATP